MFKNNLKYLFILQLLVIPVLIYPIPASASNPIENVINQIYVDVTKRAATSNEISNDFNRLSSGTITATNLVVEKLRLPEVTNKQGKIVALYDAIYNKVPTITEYNSYISKINSGYTFSQIADLIYKITSSNPIPFSTLSDSTFIQNLHKNIFNTTISQANLDYYKLLVRDKGRLSATVTMSLSSTAMSTQKKLYEVYILYSSFLKSSPSLTQIQTLINQYNLFNNFDKQVSQHFFDPRSINRYLPLLTTSTFSNSGLFIGDRYIDSAAPKLAQALIKEGYKPGIIANPGAGPCDIKNTISGILSTFAPKFIVIGYSFEQNSCYPTSLTSTTNLTNFKNDISYITNLALSKNIKVYFITPPAVPNATKNLENSRATTTYNQIKTSILNTNLKTIKGDRYFQTFLDEYQSRAFNTNGIDLCSSASITTCSFSVNLLSAYTDSITDTSLNISTNFCNQLGIIGDSRTMADYVYNRVNHIVSGDSLDPFHGSTRLLNNNPNIFSVMGYRYDTPDHINTVLLMLSKCKTRVFETILGPNHSWDTSANGETPYNWDPVDTQSMYSMLNRMTRYGGKVVVIAYFYNPTAPNTTTNQQIIASAAAHNQAVLNYINQNPTRNVSLKYINLPNSAWNNGGDLIHPTDASSETDPIVGQDWVIKESVLAAKALYPFL